MTPRARFHVNPATGRTGKCQAVHNCRFQLNEDQHYESREQAQLAYESRHDSTPEPLQKTSSSKELDEVDFDERFAQLEDEGFFVSEAHREEALEALRSKIGEHMFTNHAISFKILHKRNFDGDSTFTMLGGPHSKHPTVARIFGE